MLDNHVTEYLVLGLIAYHFASYCDSHDQMMCECLARHACGAIHSDFILVKAISEKQRKVDAAMTSCNHPKKLRMYLYDITQH